MYIEMDRDTRMVALFTEDDTIELAPVVMQALLDWVKRQTEHR